MRRVGFVIATLLSVFVVLAWAANLDLRAPLMAQKRLAFNGGDFGVVMGSALAEGRNPLRIVALSDEHTALQSLTLDVEAAAYPLLRFRFQEFPQTLELSLIFRRADSLGDIHVVSLPWPSDGVVSFDLSRIPQWRGRIREFGFAEYPTAQIVSSEQEFAPFDLSEAELWSPSWWGDFSALATDWMGFWPWSQRSVHALGRDVDTPRAHSILPSLAGLIGLIVLWSWLLLGLRGATLLRFSSVLVVLGWVALDTQWVSGLRWRQATAEIVYGEHAWPQRELQSFDSDLVRVAREVQAELAREPVSTRVLVQADAAYTEQRLMYHLLPLNVGALSLALGTGVPIPVGTLIVIHESQSAHYDPASQQLELQGHTLAVDAVVQDASVLLLRYRGAP